MSQNFEFADTDIEEQLLEIGNKLKAIQKKSIGKDGLVKLLKAAAAVLERASQNSDSQRRASKGIAEALVEKPIDGHNDRDVKTYAALCFVHVLRLHTPDCPYSPSQQQGIFGLFLWTFRRLENVGSAAFQMCNSIVDIVSQTKCCILMLDLDDSDDLVCDLFRVLLDTISVDNVERVSSSFLEMMTCLIEESDDVSPQLLDTIMDGLLDEDAQASWLMQRVLQRTEDILRPYIQKYLAAIIANEALETEIKQDRHHELIFKVYQACPQMLLPVLPHLAAELSSELVQRRLAAVDLTGSLLSIKDSGFDTEYTHLFGELVRRLNDQKADVRLAVLKHAPKVLSACKSANSRDQIRSMLVVRVEDFDDEVRVAAVNAISEAALESLDLLGGNLEPLTKIAERLRDKKPAVRQAAAAQLLNIYRASCSRRTAEDADGMHVSSDEETLAWIPARLLLVASKDPQFGTSLLNGPFKDGIFPVKLSNAAAAHHWVSIYQEATAEERAGIQRAIGLHDKLQQEVLKLLEVRNTVNSAAESDKQQQSSVQRTIGRISSTFGDPTKAEDALHKLLELKDNHIFKGLRSMCQPGATCEECKEKQKDVVQRVGSKGVVGVVVAMLCRRLTPSLLPPEQITQLLGLASQATATEHEAYIKALCDLLKDIARVAPRLFVHMGPTASALCSSADSTVAATAAHVLASAGSAMSSNADGFPTQSARGTLVKLCTGSSAQGAKAAVRAIFALFGNQEAKKHLQKPISRLSSSLQPPVSEAAAHKLLAAIAAISMAVRMLPEAFVSEAEALADFVLGELMRAANVPSGGLSISATLPAAMARTISSTLHLQLFALKAVARMCVPSSRSQNQQVLTRDASLTQGIVERLVPELDLLVGVGCVEEESDPLLAPSDPTEEGAVRLAAASALLRLARRPDDVIPVELFHKLSLTLQDPLLEVRRAFVDKVARCLRQLQDCHSSRVVQYAALLFMSGADPARECQEPAMKSLAEFTKLRRLRAEHLAARNAAKRSEGGSLLHETPEYMLPFALHLLAHHPDYPDTEGVEDAEDLAAFNPFIQMMQFGLEPLLLAPGSGKSAAAASEEALPVVYTVLRSLRRAQDCTANPQTERILALAELALQVADAIACKVQLKRQRGAPISRVPGNVPCPAKMYTANVVNGHCADGSHLPFASHVELESLFSSPPQASATKKPRARTKKRADADAAAPATPAAAASRRTKQKLEHQKADSSNDEDVPSDDNQTASHEAMEDVGGSLPSSRPPASKGRVAGPAAKPKVRAKRKAGNKAAAPGKRKAGTTSPAERRQPRRGAVQKQSMKEDSSEDEEET